MNIARRLANAGIDPIAGRTNAGTIAGTIAVESGTRPRTNRTNADLSGTTPGQIGYAGQVPQADILASQIAALTARIEALEAKLAALASGPDPDPVEAKLAAPPATPDPDQRQSQTATPGTSPSRPMEGASKRGRPALPDTPERLAERERKRRKRQRDSGNA